MRIKPLLLSLVLLGVSGAAFAAPAAPAPDVTEYAGATERLVLGDERPGIRRPVIGSWTNYYTYGVAPFGSDVTWSVTLDRNGWQNAVTMYIIWEDRVSGAARYFNLSQGLVNAETDVFSQGGDPVAILAPDLNQVDLFGPNGVLGAYPGPQATGQYQLILELRDAAGNQVIARDNAMFSFVDAAVPVSPGTSNTLNWTANNTYVLTGPTYITGSLTIEPGTFVLCEPDSDTVLAIQQGATINAAGTNKRPVVVTSSLPWSDRERGDCGGLAINGEGTINVTGGTAQGEGDSGPYGGNNPQDNSGTLTYFRIEFAGVLYSDQNELNGIAFQGVGSGTTASYLMASWGLDDGIEFFGGNNDADHVIVFNARDDSADATEGWSGELTYLCLVQTVADTDKLVEFDNNSSNVTAQPVNRGKITAATAVGTGDDSAMVFRVGSQYDLTNIVLLIPAGEKAIALGDGDVPADPTPGFPGTPQGLINNVVQQGGVPGDDPAIQTANVRMANGRNPVKPDVNLVSGNAGAQGCSARGDRWFAGEWTEWQPGPPGA